MKPQRQLQGQPRKIVGFHLDEQSGMGQNQRQEEWRSNLPRFSLPLRRRLHLPRLSVRTCGQPQIVAGLFERDSQVARYPNKKFSPLVLWRWLSVISLFEKLNEFLFCHKSIPRKAGNKILLKDTLNSRGQKLLAYKPFGFGTSLQSSARKTTQHREGNSGRRWQCRQGHPRRAESC